MWVCAGWRWRQHRPQQSTGRAFRGPGNKKNDGRTNFSKETIARRIGVAEARDCSRCYVLHIQQRLVQIGTDEHETMYYRCSPFSVAFSVCACLLCTYSDDSMKFRQKVRTEYSRVFFPDAIATCYCSREHVLHRFHAGTTCSRSGRDM